MNKGEQKKKGFNNKKKILWKTCSNKQIRPYRD